MQLLSAGNILKQAWAQYSKHFTAFREPLIWLLIPGVVMSLLPIIPGTTSGTEMLLGIIYTVIALWSAVQIIDIAWSLHEGKAPPTALTRSLAWGSTGRIVDYALVSILYGLIVIVGIFLFVVPGILFLNWFAFAPLVTLLEGAHGTGSLKRSKELVHGRFWPIAWRWIVINVVPTVIMSIFMLVVVMVIAGATSNMEVLLNTSISPWWSDLTGTVISTLSIPFYLIASVILFAEARKSR